MSNGDGNVRERDREHEIKGVREAESERKVERKNGRERATGKKKREP